jgi:uncharacterized repeat protein (TIGR02543 family)
MALAGAFVVVGQIVAATASAQATNPTAQALPYSQDFTALLHTSAVYPAGWQGWLLAASPSTSFQTTAAANNTSLVPSGAANSTAGSVYNYNGKIGFLDNSTNDYALALAVVTTGKANIAVAYDVATLRNPSDGTASNNRINEVTLQYRVGTTGSFTTLTGIEYQNNLTQQTGAGVTTPQNLASKSITLPAACDNQPVVQLRWVNRQVSGAGSRPSFMVDNVTVNGTDLHTLTINAVNGTVAPVPNQALYLHNAVVALTANPAPGYVFSNWSGDASGSTNPLNVTMDANKSITANFVLLTHTIAASAGPGGSISPSGSVVVNDGANQPFLISPNVNFAIADVLVDGGSAGAVANYTFNAVTANHTIAASFVGLNTVDAVSPAGKITLSNPTVTVPVRITRGDATPPVMGFSVAFQASSPLVLPSGRFSITLPAGGGFLNADGGRNVLLQTIDLGGGAYQADGVILGAPCGSSASTGTLFEIALSSPALAGSGTIQITSVTLRDCSNGPIAAQTGASATVNINQSAPTVAVVAPNGGEVYPVSSTQSIQWTASDPEGVASIDLAYSTDGGATYPNAIATGIANTGSYAWLVPNTVTNTARVRATAHDVDGNTAADASDADFRIGCPTITVSSAVTNVLCFGQATGAIDISVSGGTAPYTYAWGDGPTSEDRSGLIAGNYSVTVTDVYGCTGFLAVTVTEPTQLVASETHVNVLCFGQATGSIDVSVSGGTAPYSYLWADGPTTEDRSSLVAGPYSLTITDVNGCSTVLNVTITEPAELVVSETHTPTCLGTPDGSIDVSVTGGTAPYSYLWSDGPTTEDRSALVAGNYSLTVTDANGCTGGVNVTISLRTYVITASAGPNGSIVPSGAVSVDCGANQSFTISANAGYHVDDVVVDAVSQGPQSSWAFLDVQANHTIHVTFAVNPAVAAVANLSAVRQTTGNPAGSTTQIQLTWNATPPGVTVEVWRAGYGHYPQYDDAGGAEPTPSATYPPGPGWVLTAVSTSGGVDLPATRDFYYYVAYAQDVYGTRSVASNRTNGTLDYHLGDVSDGLTAGVGNNLVHTEDISLLGSHYGVIGAALAPFAYLDVGPTTTGFVDGRPTTDGRTNFEDLVMFALNYDLVSRPVPRPVEGAVAHDEMTLSAPAAVAPGADVTARLSLAGTGAVRALSTRLSWDPAVVEPVRQLAGGWLAQLGGVAFTAELGTVDVAVFSPEGMLGSGELATVEFHVLAAGDPMIRIESVDARDGQNQQVDVAIGAAPTVSVPVLPAVTQLAFAKPNPSLERTTIAFSLAAKGPVRLAVFGVDGKLLRTLASDVREAGEYNVVWDGREDSGVRVPAGVYYVRLVTDQGRFVRTLTRLR